MEVVIHQINKTRVAEIISEDILIQNPVDGLNILVDLYYKNIDNIILYEKNITPSFFVLKNGIAGEILQKFSNYKVRLAIVGNYTKMRHMSIKGFIVESNRKGQINFVGSGQKALAILSNQNKNMN